VTSPPQASRFNPIREAYAASGNGKKKKAKKGQQGGEVEAYRFHAETMQLNGNARRRRRAE
jgi:hypothetical protein